MSDFNALYRELYPRHKPAHPQSDYYRQPNRLYPKTQLLCHMCKAKINRDAPRIWGNPHCGGCFRGPAPIRISDSFMLMLIPKKPDAALRFK